MVGYVGTILLILAFVMLNTKSFASRFLITNFIATGFLFTHAVQVGDVPFVVSNMFILVMIVVKLTNKNRR